MKLSTIVLLFGVAAVPSLPAADAPANVGIVLQFTEAQFLATAQAMPEKLYRFAPSGPGFEGVRTFAEQVKHVACGTFAFFNEIENKTPPEHCEKGGPSRTSTKAELVQYLRDSFDYGNKVLQAMRDASGQEKVKGQYWGDTTSLTVAVAAVWHIADHYGQIVPYLRMNKIVPPPTSQYPQAVR